MRLLLWFAIISWIAGPGWGQSIRPTVGALKVHTAANGEDLAEIALQYGLAVDHLAFANGFSVDALEVEPGTRLFVPTWRVLPADPPRDGLVLNLPERGLFFFRGGKFQKFYPVSIGDESAEGGRFRTPTGRFSIIEKIPNPTWYPPAWAKDRTPVGPGPKNPLGERWIGLSLPRTGIHGTNDPLNVGNSVTHGCVRMHPSMLIELYNQIKVGFEVRIEYETVKVGRDASGQLVLVSLPDVYARKSSLKQLPQLLQRLRVKPRRANFVDIVGLNLGLPISILGTDSVYSELCKRCHIEEED